MGSHYLFTGFQSNGQASSVSHVNSHQHQRAVGLLLNAPRATVKTQRRVVGGGAHQKM